MAEKRDYYEVLGVDKSATDQDLKRLIVSWLKSITRTPILVIKKPKRNLKRLPKRMRY